jgi:hypothetical protein
MADYPISNVARRIVYTGSAGVGPYAFNFEVLANTDLNVYKNDVLLTLTTNYTVTISPTLGTGSITLVVAATGADRITIVGARAIQRTTDFTTGGDFFANTLNDEMDSQTILVQQVAETAERSIKAPVTDPTSINMTLPKNTDRAGKYLSFNASTGNPEVVNTVTDVTTVAANSANITTVATNIASVNTAATNIAAIIAAPTQATNAANSATAASASATSAAASYDSFDDRYLGSKAANPTLDNDGNALLTGALYFNSVSNAMKVWSGSVWLDAYSLSTVNISSIRTTATAGQTVITGLNYTTGTNSLLVYVNGSKQISSVNYNETSSSSITFLTGLSVGDTVECLTTAYQAPGGGAVTGVAATAPIASTGGTSPVISIPQATAVVDGYLKATDFVTFNNKYATGGALGTPSSGTATNLTGTAAGLTAGNVTTNANLTGEVTSVGNAATLTNSAVISKVITGYTSGAGTVAATDTILQAIQKLNGNDATNANLTGPITSVGNATSIASQTGTGSKFVVDTSPTLVTPTATTTIGVGNATPSASGAGITFPATQSASTNANTLDDYEEGTWTPTVAAATGTLGAVTTKLGTYTKIGKLVTLQMYFNIATGTGAGYIIISNLPFAQDTTLAFVAGTGIYISTGEQYSCYLNASSIYGFKYNGTMPVVFCTFTLSYWATA